MEYDVLRGGKNVEKEVFLWSFVRGVHERGFLRCKSSGRLLYKL